METDELQPADPADLRSTIQFAIQHNAGRKTGRVADEREAGLIAARVMEQMRMSGYVVLKKPSAPPSSAGPSGRWHGKE